MKKKEDKNTRYFIDLNLITNEIINWDSDQRDLLAEEKINIPGLHRVFISKGQYNKLVEKNMKLEGMK